jgi:acyl transferase domain-containing protein
VQAVAAQLEGVKSQRLTVSHAFHSPLMEPMLEAFRRVAERIVYHPPRLRLVSNVTSQLAGDEIATPDYWVRHVREAVRFADGVAALHSQGIQIFLEIGPKPVLLSMAGGDSGQWGTGGSEQRAGGRGQEAERTALLPSLRPGQSDWQQLLGSLGELYVRGVQVDWEGVDQGHARRKVALPTYPFQRQGCCVAAPAHRQGHPVACFAECALRE